MRIPVLLYNKFHGFHGEFFSYDSYSPWYDDDYDGELLFYYGRELNGDFLFMTIQKSDYNKRIYDPYAPKMDIRDVDTTQLTRMHPTDAAKLHHRVQCYVCNDEVRGDDEEGEDWGCGACNNLIC